MHTNTTSMKKMSLLMGATCLALLTLGCQQEAEPVPTGISNQTLTHAGVTREYVLYVPESYDANAPTPLVLNFHGFGGEASGHAELVGDFYGMHAIAEQEPFLLVSPQGVERAKGGAEWDPEDNGSPDISENDGFFTEQLIVDVDADYNVDLSRVYAIGYSNGGMMAYGLACNSSDRIAAVGIMSGTMLPDDCDNSQHTSVIHFHGLADEVIAYDGGGDFSSIPDVIDFWAAHNDIPPSNLTTTSLNGGDVTRTAYTGGSDNTDVVLYTIEREYDKPGGHVWFGYDIDGVSPNQLLWNFLSGYSLED